MKLLTHNMLKSHVKGVKNGYPFRVIASKVIINTVDFNSEFVVRMIPKLDWGVLRTTAQSLGQGMGLPEELPDTYESNEEFLRSTHQVLVEVEVMEGELQCPESGRKFPITEGIPNMLLREDEV